jgi:hypothetical protein
MNEIPLSTRFDNSFHSYETGLSKFEQARSIRSDMDRIMAPPAAIRAMDEWITDLACELLDSASQTIDLINKQAKQVGNEEQSAR